MAGIYIHVPFCKTRCAYCDFFTQTDAGDRGLYVKAIAGEAKSRSAYLDGEPVDTIYLGGGTPSQLSPADISLILKSISDNFIVSDHPEITLEANPDDLDMSYLQSLLGMGFNRLSIGVQSFDDDRLKFLNRRHSSEKAVEAVEAAQRAGFGNISIDLMYGLPGQTLPLWEKTLETAIALNIQHISAYHLIYEEGTALYQWLLQGAISPVDEELSLDMFSMMIDKLRDAGFIHYEISNFGKENCFSRHNTSYWTDALYLGLGPAAHSYNKKSRCSNVASIRRYIEGIEAGKPDVEEEILTERDKYNDYILTRMRTMWGIDASWLENNFEHKFSQYFQKNIKKHIASANVAKDNSHYKLTRAGIFISDAIMSDLMYID